MKGSNRITLLTLLCVFTFATVIGVTSAATAGIASLTITDVSGSYVMVTHFNVKDTVYVRYTIDDTDLTVTADITVIDDDGYTIGIPHLGVTGSGEFSFVPLKEGIYTINVNGAPVEAIAVATVFVLPESVFGALAAMGAGLAAFGIVKFKYKKI